MLQGAVIPYTSPLISLLISGEGYSSELFPFDPYDTFCRVDIGIIGADILLSSSSWHDHGHIGASPKAHIYTYPGSYKNSGLLITGIEVKETRGSPTVVFNLKYSSFSITNFADFGQDQDFSSEDKLIIESTNIAFIRPSIVGSDIKNFGENTHNEKALKYCQPAVIIPEHYFPESFINDQVVENEKESFLKPNVIVDEMVENFKYPIKVIDDYSIWISSDELSSRKILCKILKIHPQVLFDKTSF